MSDTAFRAQYPLSVSARRTDWGAIWAGVFTFAAIWTVFEVLGLVILPVASAGMAVWTIILTVIAMYIAGLETGRLAGVASRHDGLIHGVIMFGLSAVSVMIVTAFVGGALTVAHTAYTLPASAGAQWAMFAALFLGWLAAMGGASTGVSRQSAHVKQPVQPPIPMRPAA